MGTRTTEKGDRQSAPWLWIAAGLGALVFLGIRTIARGGIWIHLATGRQVLESGIPRADTWSFSLASDTPWVADGWLYGVLLHLLWAAGPAVTILVHVAAAAAAFTLLCIATRQTVSGPAIALGMCLCSWLLAPVFEVGPHILAVIFPALFVFVLLREVRPAVRWSVLIVAQILWTNIHLTFVMGPVIVAVFAIAAARQQPGDDGEAAPDVPDTPVMHTVYLAIACLAVTMLNPYGPGLYAKLVSLLQHPDGYIESREWLSLFSGQFGSSLFKNVNTLALAVGAGGLVTHRGRLPLSLTILAILGAATSVIAPLQVQLFAVLALPFLCLSFNAIGVFICELLKGPLANGLGRRLGAGLVGVIVVATILLCVTHQFYRIVGSDSGFGLGVTTASLPAHIDEVINHPAFPERAYHIAHDGSYLHWRYPDRPVYIDQRTGLYVDGQSQTLFKAMGGDEEAMATLDEDWPADAIILNATWPGCGGVLLNLLPGNKWRLVYFDGTTPVLVRNKPEYKDLFTDTDLQQAGLDLLAEEYTQYRQVVAGIRGAPINGRLLGAASVFFHLQRFKKAHAAYDLLLLNAPAMKMGWYFLGVTQLQNGDAEQAAASLERAAQFNAQNPLPWLYLSRAYAASDRPVEAARAYARGSDLSPERADEFGDPTEEKKEDPGRSEDKDDS